MNWERGGGCFFPYSPTSCNVKTKSRLHDYFKGFDGFRNGPFFDEGNMLLGVFRVNVATVV